MKKNINLLLLTFILLSTSSCKLFEKFGKNKNNNINSQSNQNQTSIDQEEFEDDESEPEDPKLADVKLTTEDLNKGTTYNLFIHGFESTGSVWEPLINFMQNEELFSKKGNHIIHSPTISDNGNKRLKIQANEVIATMPSSEELKKYTIINIFGHSMGAEVAWYVAKILKEKGLGDRIRVVNYSPALNGIYIIKNAKVLRDVLEFLKQIIKDTKNIVGEGLKITIEGLLGIDIVKAIENLEAFIDHYTPDFLDTKNSHHGLLDIQVGSPAITEMRQFIKSSGIKGWVAVCKGGDEALHHIHGIDESFYSPASILLTEYLDLGDLPKNAKGLLNLLQNKITRKDRALPRFIASLNGKPDLAKGEHDGMIGSCEQHGGGDLPLLRRVTFDDLYHSNGKSTSPEDTVLGNKSVHKASINFVKKEYRRRLKELKLSTKS